MKRVTRYILLFFVVMFGRYTGLFWGRRPLLLVNVSLSGTIKRHMILFCLMVMVKYIVFISMIVLW